MNFDSEHTNFISTAGSAISGAAGGAVVGSFFGLIGTVIGASMGVIIGGYAQYHAKISDHTKSKTNRKMDSNHL